MNKASGNNGTISKVFKYMPLESQKKKRKRSMQKKIFEDVRVKNFHI